MIDAPTRERPIETKQPLPLQHGLETDTEIPHPKPSTEETAEQEEIQATEEAEMLVPRTKLRSETHRQAQVAQINDTKKSLGTRWMNAPKRVQEYIHGLNQKKGLLAASALLALSSVSSPPEMDVVRALETRVSSLVAMANLFPSGLNEDKAEAAEHIPEIAARLPELTPQQQKIKQSIQEYSKGFAFTTTINTPDGNRSISVSMPFGESNYGYKGNGRLSVDRGKQLQKAAEAKKQAWQESIVQKVNHYQQAEQAYQQYAEQEKQNGSKPMDKNIFLKQKYGYDINTIFIWNIKDPYERAFYEHLRELGVYTDCSGTTYNLLRNAYDTIHGQGNFDKYIQKTTGLNMNLMSSDRWFDQRLSRPLGTPPVKDLRPGDVIGIKNVNGKVSHVITVEGWEEVNGQTYLDLWQATDESEDHGVFKYKVKVTENTENLPIHKQEWNDEQGQQAKLAEQTTLGEGLGGQSFLKRLVHQDNQGKDVLTYTVARLKVLQ